MTFLLSEILLQKVSMPSPHSNVKKILPDCLALMENICIFLKQLSILKKVFLIVVFKSICRKISFH